MRGILPIVASFLLVAPGLARGDAPGSPAVRLTEKTIAGLAFRGIGPAVASGRVSDLAIHPSDPATWYVAAASGGVWKTTNGGTTWSPIFDDHGSYSIGSLAIDPTDPLVVWVGTGENKSQRSVGYGDGVYKSLDGGKSWTRVGLEKSEHIGPIVIDPRDSNTVYVAAEGPLWNAGGDRGLYKTTDGGSTWRRVLGISDNTGVTDIELDPRDPDVLYAASYQRRRRVWTFIGGGPESAIHKSTDAGNSWTKLSTGLPEGDLGRIGLAMSPVDPNTLYAIIEAERDRGGFFRSTDRGSSWEKRSSYVSMYPMYYQELVADPVDRDRVYSMDTFLQVSEDGGRTWRSIDRETKHVDNHALWIDPRDNRHLIAGCDGGVYESRDRGASWAFFPNLPITQFYRVTADNDRPFYNVYGGTQDNATLGGPSRTLDAGGIRNADWFITVGGDGFKTQVDPEDPDTIYSQWQYGNLVRFDRRTGEVIDIQPQPEPDEPPLRFNWDSPLIISPHSSSRLYFGANRLFRSDDRGNSWKAVSGDLTRQLDRNRFVEMGWIWGVDAVSRNAFTSFYGNIVSLSESPLAEGVLYVGTDDGLVQVSEDGGGSWARIDSVKGVPDRTYVSDVEASRHDPHTVYAAFDAHKDGDYRPYLFRSTDRGRSWTNIGRGLPERGTVYTVAEDHVRPELLVVGTEFGVFYTPDGGRRWVPLKGGLPVIAVRDIEIQRREDDLVIATFGRGIYILDDYSPLRTIDERLLDREAVLFDVRPAIRYIPRRPLGDDGKGSQGDAFFTAPNPPSGAVFTYYLRDGLRTRAEERRERERKRREAGEPNVQPTWEELRLEDREEPPAIVLTISDEAGQVVRRIKGPASAGFHRAAWDLRYPSPDPIVSGVESGRAAGDRLEPGGPLVVPGTYRVSLAARSRGETIELVESRSFSVTSLDETDRSAATYAATTEFDRRVAELERTVFGAYEVMGEVRRRLDRLSEALLRTPAAPIELTSELDRLKSRVADLRIALVGDETVARRHEPTSPSIHDHVERIASSRWSSLSPPTATHRRSYAVAAEAFDAVLRDLRRLVEEDLVAIEERLERAGAPWTPGRIPLTSDGPR